MSQLVDVLRSLGRDAELAGEYEKDPDAVLGRYQLSEEERKALLAGDVDAVSRLSGQTDVHMSNTTVKAPD